MYKIVRAEYVWRMASMAFEIVGEPHARSSLVCWASRCPITASSRTCPSKVPKLLSYAMLLPNMTKQGRRTEESNRIT